MVVIFVLLFFTLGHFFLSNALSGRDKALAQLNTQIAQLADLLSMEKEKSSELGTQVGRLRASLEKSSAENESLSADLKELQARRDELDALLATVRQQLEGSRREASAQEARAAEAQDQVTLLNQQISALRQQLKEISDALALAEAKNTEQEEQIADLGKRLNLALASRVKELEQYRSEFFGRLRQVLGDRPDIRIVGDRFVFQSELLFDTASADLGPRGQAQVRQVVNVLKELMPKIPDDINWVLRIDGHTDKRPISTPDYPSNWELSTARALAIVKYMIGLGVPPGRLAATGFGEYHPLDPANTPEAWAKNRRIEIKLTER